MRIYDILIFTKLSLIARCLNLVKIYSHGGFYESTNQCKTYL